MKSKTTLLLLIFFISGTAFAQQKAVDPGYITPGEKVFEYMRVEGEKSRTFGTIYERINRDDEQNLITITFLQELPNATLTDSIVLDGETLSPLRYRSLVPGMQDIRVDYVIPGKTVINMVRKIPDQSVDTTMTAQIESTVYDYHWPHTLLYALVPLETEDDVINLPVFTYRNKTGMQPISYGGQEAVELHGQKYNAWVWNAADPQSGTEHTYWIDASTNRLLQSRAALSNGVVFWFRRKDASGD